MKKNSFQSAQSFCFVKVSSLLLGNGDICPFAGPFFSTLIASPMHLQAGLPFPGFHDPRSGLSSLTPSFSFLMPPSPSTHPR